MILLMTARANFIRFGARSRLPGLLALMVNSLSLCGYAGSYTATVDSQVRMTIEVPMAPRQF